MGTQEKCEAETVTIFKPINILPTKFQFNVIEFNKCLLAGWQGVLIIKSIWTFYRFMGIKIISHQVS